MALKDRRTEGLPDMICRARPHSSPEPHPGSGQRPRPLAAAGAHVDIAARGDCIAKERGTVRSTKGSPSLGAILNAGERRPAAFNQGFYIDDGDGFIAPAMGSSGIYLANAAHGLPSAPVLAALQDFLLDVARYGGARALARHSDQFEKGYGAAARLIGAEVDEVAFLESGNRAIQALIQSARLQPGDHVLVDRTCWGGTLGMLAELPGVVVDVMPVDETGRLDVAATRAGVHARTRCIVLTWCPATSGVINPAVDIGALAHDLGAFYFVDACQMLGQRPVDVRSLQCHGLAASGRKWLRGPRGTSLLFASRAYLEARSAFMADQFGKLRTDARQFEQGEAAFAGRLALGVAIQGVLTIGQDRIAAHLTNMSGRIREGLRQIERTHVIEQGDSLSAIVGFHVENVSVPEVLENLERNGVRIGALTEAYAPLDMMACGLSAVLRAAPQIYTTEEDIEAFLNAIDSLQAAGRQLTGRGAG